MKRTVLLTGLLSMLYAGIAEAAFIGAIDTENKPFQLSVGANGSYISMDREIGGDEVKTSQYVLVGEVGCSVKGWELGVAVGGTSWEYNRAGAVVQGDADSEILPYARIDFGGPIFRGKVLTIAPFVQVSYSDGFEDTAVVTDGTSTIPGWVDPVTGYEKLTYDETYELTAGLLFQVTIDGAQLYGGPAYYRSESEVSSTLTAHDSSVPANSFTNMPLGSRDITEAKLIGGILGVSWPLETGFVLEVEGQWFDGAGISGSLSYPF